MASQPTPLNVPPRKKVLWSGLIKPVVSLNKAGLLTLISPLGGGLGWPANKQIALMNRLKGWSILIQGRRFSEGTLLWARIEWELPWIWYLHTTTTTTTTTATAAAAAATTTTTTTAAATTTTTTTTTTTSSTPGINIHRSIHNSHKLLWLYPTSRAVLQSVLTPFIYSYSPLETHMGTYPPSKKVSHLYRENDLPTGL